ncbi:MAG: hypothetical protein Q7Q71_16125 [Verrucomicrobiota bacterium JB023]|nr:hypothetical protein [Verrucomicrobiota bacterium JB023]
MRLLLVAIAGLLAACGTREVVEVKQFTVRETEVDWSEDPLVRGEMQKRLYGAISQKERRDRLGQYFSIRWRVPQGPVAVVFDYRQSGTGSRIHRLRKDYGFGGSEVVEIAINGENYRESGRVTSWRARVYRDDQLLGEKRSFLWE